MKSFGKHHVLSLLAAIPLSWLLLSVLFQFSDQLITVKSPEAKEVVGSRTWCDTNVANLLGHDSLALQLAGNLNDKQTLVLFGSSEFTDLPFAPYRFLPDSMGIPAFGFGHAHHQDFAIYAQLLALEDYLDNSRICVVLSPGWFETDGTNIEAFLEFVRPDFLKHIAHSKTVSLDEKITLGAYIHRNYSLISNAGPTLDYFRNLYLFHQVPGFKAHFVDDLKQIQPVNYTLRDQVQHTSSRRSTFDWNVTGKILQNKFLQTAKSNHLFVADAYYHEFIRQADGSERKGNFDPVALDANQEFKDFKMLVALLKKHHCKASFVMQGLNPYHYEHLERFAPIESAIQKELKQAGFAYFSLFTTSPRHYDPGTLNDIMHLGDYGWLKIDRFLTELYEK